MILNIAVIQPLGRVFKLYLFHVIKENSTSPNALPNPIGHRIIKLSKPMNY
jgi:hypothetical protein